MYSSTSGLNLCRVRWPFFEANSSRCFVKFIRRYVGQMKNAGTSCGSLLYAIATAYEGSDGDSGCWWAEGSGFHFWQYCHWEGQRLWAQWYPQWWRFCKWLLPTFHCWNREKDDVRLWRTWPASLTSSDIYSLGGVYLWRPIIGKWSSSCCKILLRPRRRGRRMFPLWQSLDHLQKCVGLIWGTRQESHRLSESWFVKSI